MNRRILSPRTILYAILLVVVDLSIMPHLRVGDVQPSIAYLLILYVAFKWHWQKSIPMAIVIGLLYDIMGSHPFGVETISLILACLVLNLAVQKIERYFVLMRLLTTFLFVLGVSMIVYVLSWTLGQSVPTAWHAFGVIFMRALFATVLMPFFFEASIYWFKDREYLKQYELFG